LVLPKEYVTTPVMTIRQLRCPALDGTILDSGKLLNANSQLSSSFFGTSGSSSEQLTASRGLGMEAKFGLH